MSNSTSKVIKILQQGPLIVTVKIYLSLCAWYDIWQPYRKRNNLRKSKRNNLSSQFRVLNKFIPIHASYPSVFGARWPRCIGVVTLLSARRLFMEDTITGKTGPSLTVWKLYFHNISRVFLVYFRTTENISFLWNWKKLGKVDFSTFFYNISKIL